MTEPTITAEDLTLYALELLEGDEREHVEAMLRASTEARRELARIRGDLALFALAVEQQTPPAPTRQRLLKQVARERRTQPIDMPVEDHGDLPASPSFVADAAKEGVRPEALERTQTQGPEAQTPFPIREASQRATSSALSGSAPDSQQPRLEPETVTFATDAGDPGRPERASLAQDPQLFAREGQVPATSASARSVTMFEQHFAADATGRVPEAGSGTDPGRNARRAQRSPDAVDATEEVQDRYVPSRQREDDAEEGFGFSAYQQREPDEPRSSGLSRFFGWSGWLVATAVAVAAVFAWRDDFQLRELVSEQRSLLAVAQADAARAATVMLTLQSPASQRFVLARTDTPPAPGGRVAYLPERGTLVFQASNLQTLQPYKTYELWLIPAGKGQKPVPAGLFKPDGHGYASVVLPQLPRGLVAANFGVTIEDEGGSASPTLPILLVGQQG